jgi:hypothetical protein
MKVTIPIGLLLVVAMIAYLLGTESGKAQRDVVLVKLGRKDAPGVDDTATSDVA